MSVNVEVVDNAARITAPEPVSRAVVRKRGRLVYAGPLPADWDSGEAVWRMRERRLGRGACPNGAPLWLPGNPHAQRRALQARGPGSDGGRALITLQSCASAPVCFLTKRGPIRSTCHAFSRSARIAITTSNSTSVKARRRLARSFRASVAGFIGSVWPHCPNCKTRKYCRGAEDTVVALVAKFSSSDCHEVVARSAQR